MLSVFIRTSKGLMRPTGSDILYFNLMGSDIIVLNSFEAATTAGGPTQRNDERRRGRRRKNGPKKPGRGRKLLNELKQSDRRISR